MSDPGLTSARVGRFLVPVAHVLSIPIYVVYELFVRLVNRSAPPLEPRIREVVAPLVSDVDLDAVRLRAPAWIPTGHGGLTLGRRIFIGADLDADSIDDMALVVHELVHVRQCERWGRFAMMRRYGVEWARVLSYDRHPLEVEAVAAQEFARRLLADGIGRP